MGLPRLRPNRFPGAMLQVLLFTVSSVLATRQVVEAGPVRNGSSSLFPHDCQPQDCQNGGECRRRVRQLSDVPVNEEKGYEELTNYYYCVCDIAFQGVHCEEQRRHLEGDISPSPVPDDRDSQTNFPTPDGDSSNFEPTIAPTPLSPNDEIFSIAPSLSPVIGGDDNPALGTNFPSPAPATDNFDEYNGSSSAPTLAPVEGDLIPPPLDPPMGESQSPTASASPDDGTYPTASPSPFDDSNGFPLPPTDPPTDPPGKRSNDDTRDPPGSGSSSFSNTAAEANYDDGDLSGGHIFGITLAVFCFLGAAYCFLSNRKPRPRRGLDGMQEMELSSGWVSHRNHHDDDGLL